MGIKVSTQYLQGYADQMDGNANNALNSIKKYCEGHCKNYAGLEGILAAAKGPVGQAADSMIDMVDKSRLLLATTARDLRTTAQLYDKAEMQAAEKVWNAAIKSIWETEGVPRLYPERKISSSRGKFTTGAQVELAPPRDYKESDEAKRQVYDLLGYINKIVEQFTGYDILETVLPIVFGEWGALKRIGDAWGHIEKALVAVGDDLETGINVLSPHWDSTATGYSGASRNFDYRVRSDLIPIFGALAKKCAAIKQICEFVAKVYEDAVRDLLFILNFYGLRIRKTINALFGAASLNKAKLILNLTLLATSLIGLIRDIIDMIVTEIEKYKEGIDAIIAWHSYVFDRGSLHGLR